MDELKPEYIIIGIIAPWIALAIKIAAAKGGEDDPGHT